MASSGGASASGSHSQSASHSGALFTPDPNTFSQAYSGIYQRDMPGILKFLQEWIPQLNATNTQSAGATTQQDFAQMQQLLGMENANKSQAAKGNLENYQNYEAPLQMLQNQVADYSARQKDPEYYKTRENTSNQLNSLLSGQLNGSELSNIERGLNRQFLQNGTFNTPGNTQQLQAATTYGDAGRSRQMAAIGLANQALPGFRTSEVGPVSTAARPISDAMAKTDTTAANETSKMLFYNPVDEANKAFTTALGIPASSSRSGSSSGGLGCG